MNQRLLAAVIAVPLVLALLLAAALIPLPYVTYKPGQTVDVLAQDANEAEIVQVVGHKTYRDDGQLRMTTVLVTPPEAQINLFDLMTTWLDPEDAVYPHDAIYPEDKTDEENDVEGAVSMVTSQDTAIAVAQTELGYDVRPALQVAFIDEDGPAQGKLRVRDIFLSVDGEKITTDQELRDGIQAAESDTPVRLGILRSGRRLTVPIVPEQVDGQQLIGIRPGIGYRFPFEVSVNIPPEISGPSAGLMFSLAIYDTLTPGSMSGGGVVAGTGEINPDGTVVPIGGIQQKIAGAEEAGAELFLVPAGNCVDVAGIDSGDTRLVMAETMHSARLAVEEWAENPETDLPTCEDAA